jgi:predicted Zn-dependent protease
LEDETVTGRIKVDLIEVIKERVYNLVLDSRKGLNNCDYIDVRIEASESKFATAQNGAPKESAEESQMSFRVRVIAGDNLKAPGYCCSYLALPNLMDIERIVKSC